MRAIKNSFIGSLFKVRFYESDDATVACDTMLTLECAPDTINRCMIISNAYAECLPESNAYKLTFQSIIFLSRDLMLQN
ncbi:MAG: hypothetical protein IPM92_08105 [Saprospiraceae bacterium]|nr:hypothetical protein [Saprospiraceae bacterium]